MGAMSRKESLFTFRLSGIVLALLGLEGEEAAALLAAAGLPPSAAHGACTVPLSRVRAFVDEAARRRPDPLLGLSLAEAVPEGTYDAAELLVRTASTIGEGLAALARHAPLINPLGQFRYEETPTQAELHYLVAGQPEGLGRHMNEFTLAYVVRSLGRLTGGPLPLGAAWFAHERPAEFARVEAYFGCPIRFRAASSGVAFSRETAARPLRSGDRVVFGYLSRHAATIQHDAGPSPFSLSVAHAIEDEIGFARTDLGSVARHLAITERTAQRRLREEGTSFRDVLDQARKRRAEGLAKNSVPDERIAALLGFADVATYRRATRRWSS
jgi:AraC-like DNA-binding protein